MEQKPAQNPPSGTEGGGVSDTPDVSGAQLLAELAAMDESEILALACAEGLGGPRLKSLLAHGGKPRLGTLDDQELLPDGPMSPEQYQAYMNG